MKKTDIAKILEWHNSGTLKTDEAVERICSLFSVVRQSEQLCYCGKPEDSRYSPCCSLDHWHDKFS